MVPKNVSAFLLAIYRNVQFRIFDFEMRELLFFPDPFRIDSEQRMKHKANQVL